MRPKIRKIDREKCEESSLYQMVSGMKNSVRNKPNVIACIQAMLRP